MSAPATVLVVRALGLGDALVAVAGLRGLRRLWPTTRLVLAGPLPVGGWLRDHGIVDAVVHAAGLAPLRPETLVQAVRASPGVIDGPVDVALNFHGIGPQSTAALHALHPGRVVAYAGPHYPDGPAWDLDEHEVDRWVRLVAEVGACCGRDDLPVVDHGDHGGPVVVHPGAASGARRWGAERWARVVAALADRGHQVVVTGGPGERSLTAQVSAAGGRDLGGALDLPALADLVARAAVVLCGDTGVGHLATATRTPSVLLFGPSRPGQWGPAVDLDRHVVLWPAPEGYRGDAHAAAVDPVLAGIGEDEVLAAAEDLLTAGAEPGALSAPASAARSAAPA